MEITIDLTEQDFSRICERSGSWGPKFEEQAERFENMTPGKATEDEPSYEWSYMHDAAESWTSVILATAFLKASGHDFEILWDTNQTCYWILTDYETSTWRQMREREASNG